MSNEKGEEKYDRMIYASQWKEMCNDEIEGSLRIGISVLKERFSSLGIHASGKQWCFDTIKVLLEILKETI
jgi:hypothetical protein